MLSNSKEDVYKKLLQQESLLKAVADASMTLLTEKHFNKSVIQALQLLGEATTVDRVYIFENHEHPVSKKPATSQRFEWSNDGVDPQINNPDLQNVPYEDLNLLWWYESLVKNEPINVLIKNVPEGGREVLDAQGIISLLVVPIYNGEHLWGFMGFDDCHEERTWTTNEISILISIATSLGGVMKRKETEAILQNTLHKLEDLNENLEEKVKKAVAESRQKDIMLQQQAKQVAMGDIINSIAHQWRQPLNGISLAASNILLDIELEEEVSAENATTIVELANSMSQTISDFMEFFNDKKETSIFKLKDVFTSTMDLVQSQIYGRNILVCYEILEELEIKTYKNELQQVVINFITNAIQAFDNDKLIKQKQITIRGFIDNDQNNIHIEIQDNAGGIEEQFLPKIFEPYFTTKEKGKGTGLGLSISKNIIENSLLGSLNVCNKEHGALFHIILPLELNVSENGDYDD